MEITDPSQANNYFEACVEHSMRFGADREEAERIERSNIGYHAGYFDRETLRTACHLLNSKKGCFTYHKLTSLAPLLELQ